MHYRFDSDFIVYCTFSAFYILHLDKCFVPSINDGHNLNSTLNISSNFKSMTFCYTYISCL